MIPLPMATSLVLCHTCILFNAGRVSKVAMRPASQSKSTRQPQLRRRFGREQNLPKSTNSQCRSLRAISLSTRKLGVEYRITSLPSAKLPVSARTGFLVDTANQANFPADKRHRSLLIPSLSLCLPLRCPAPTPPPATPTPASTLPRRRPHKRKVHPDSLVQELGPVRAVDRRPCLLKS